MTLSNEQKQEIIDGLQDAAGATTSVLPQPFGAITDTVNTIIDIKQNGFTSDGLEQFKIEVSTTAGTIAEVFIGAPLQGMVTMAALIANKLAPGSGVVLGVSGTYAVVKFASNQGEGVEHLTLNVLNNPEYSKTVEEIYNSVDSLSIQVKGVLESFSDIIEHSINNIFTDSNATNTLLDSSTSFNTSASQPNYYDIRNDWQSGLAVSGGNYAVYMKPNVLNGNGYFNIMPSFLATDGWRPGAQQTSSFSLFKDFSDFYKSYSSTSLSSPYLDSFGANNYRTDSVGFANIDPLVLDLNNNGIELASYANSNVLFDVDNDGFKEQTGWVGANDNEIKFRMVA